MMMIKQLVLPFCVCLAACTPEAPPTKSDAIKLLDTDNSRGVSRSEWMRSATQSADYAKSRDPSFPKDQFLAEAARNFEQADRNRDGQVVEAEW